jgi:hypothetical protein
VGPVRTVTLHGQIWASSRTPRRCVALDLAERGRTRRPIVSTCGARAGGEAPRHPVKGGRAEPWTAAAPSTDHADPVDPQPLPLCLRERPRQKIENSPARGKSGEQSGTRMVGTMAGRIYALPQKAHKTGLFHAKLAERVGLEPSIRFGGQGRVHSRQWSSECRAAVVGLLP